MLELHCHTTYSDGTLTPTELIHTAHRAGIQALAVTDHDTIAGWSEVCQAAAETSIEVVPGIEISTTHRERSLHILGFYPCPERLAPALVQQQTRRHQRALEILERLKKLGYSLDLHDLNSPTPGRTHIATALVRAGHVPSTRIAFDRLLAAGGDAYVPSHKLSPLEAIALLHDCGAVPVWAHPYRFKGGPVEDVLPELLEAGLMGLEVYHPGHSPEQIHRLRQLGDSYSLLVTGGSDYHGPEADPRGTHSPTLNTFNLPLTLLPPIQAAAPSFHHHQSRCAPNQETD